MSSDWESQITSGVWLSELSTAFNPRGWPRREGCVSGCLCSEDRRRRTPEPAEPGRRGSIVAAAAVPVSSLGCFICVPLVFHS